MTLRKGDPRRATVDHIQPLSRGGSDHPDNLQAACRACNQAKGASWTPAPETP